MRARAEKLLCHGAILLAVFVSAGAIVYLALILLIFMLDAFDAPRWLLVLPGLLLYPVLVLPGLLLCLYLWPDRLPHAVTPDARRSPSWVRLVAGSRLIVILLLAGAAFLTLFWTELAHDSVFLLFAFSSGGLLWLLTVLWVVVEHWPSRIYKTICVGALVGGAILVSFAPEIGERFRLWPSERNLQAMAHVALARSAANGVESPDGTFAVDTSEDPPKRVVFFWHRSRDGWDGVVYDPSGRITDLDRIRIGTESSGIHARHLWGPWYRAFGS